MENSEAIEYSIVVPVYCEAESLVELTDRIHSVLTSAGSAGAFEIILVDDGSVDKTPAVISKLCAERPYVRSITLRRNCGKSMALMVGFGAVRGNFVLTIDADLQDHPEDFPALIRKLNEGYDVVSGWREKRHDTASRRIGSRIFNNVTARFTGLKLHDFNSGLKAYRRNVVETLCIYGQYHRYIPLLAHILGYKVAEVVIRNSERKHGASKYRTFRYHGSFDLMSILFIYKFGASPLHFFGLVSAALVIPSFGLLFYWLIEHGLWILGFGEEYRIILRPLMMLALVVLLLGIVIFLVGFVCDFILHHQIRSNIRGLTDLYVERSSPPGLSGSSRATQQPRDAPAPSRTHDLV